MLSNITYPQNLPTMQQLVNEFNLVNNEMEERARNCLKMDLQVIGDFNKVCQLKQIPNFFSNYLIYALKGLDNHKYEQEVQQHIKSILSSQSHYHCINDAITERLKLLQELSIHSEIVSAFLTLNSGKEITSAMRSRINGMIGNATSLKEIKEIEKNAVFEFGDSIMKVRTNSVLILKQVNLWREYLTNLSSEFCQNEIRIIFPAPSGINCCLMPLYDQNVILESFLTEQLSIPNQNNPFLLISDSSENSNELSQTFRKAIEKDQVNYDMYASMIEKEILSMRESKIKEKRGENEEEKIRKYSSNKEKTKEKELKQILGDGTKSKSPKKKRNSLIDVESILQKHKQKIREEEEERKSNLNSFRNDKSMVSFTKVELKEAEENNENGFDDKIKAILDQKAYLEQQLKEATVKNKEYERLIKKIERNEIQTNKKVERSKEKELEGSSNFDDRSSKKKSIEEIYKNLGHKNKNQNHEKGQEIDLQSISPETHKKSLSKLSKTPTDERKKAILDGEENKRVKDNIISGDNQVSLFNQNMYENKLNEERNEKVLLEKNFKELLKEKTKLERVIEKSDNKLAKEKEENQRKIEKYEETIRKLQRQKGQSSKLEGYEEVRGRKDSGLRISTLSDMKQEENVFIENLKRNSRGVESFKNIKEEDDVSDRRSNDGKSESRYSNKVEIVKTQKTIEIIYTGRNSMKSKVSGTESIKKSLVEESQKYVEKSKQKNKESDKNQEGLFPKLNRMEMKIEKESKTKNKVMVEDSSMDKYRSVIQTEKEKKFQLENKIKSLKKDLYEEYEHRLQNEKQRFEQEKHKLLNIIETEKDENKLKEKYLSNQIKVLMMMERNENELLNLLEIEKKNRIEKERELANEIKKKEDLLKVIEIEEIKKGLHQEIKKEFATIDNEDTFAMSLEFQKSKLKELIEEMNEEQNAELREMDEENEKLKSLIAKIKAEENSLISVIKKNIEEDREYQKLNEVLDPPSEDEEVRHNVQQKTEVSNISDHNKKNTHQKSEKKNKITKANAVDYIQTEEVQKEKNKEKINRVSQKKINDKNEQMIEVENLVEMYLHQPHEYPQSKTQSYSKAEKEEMQRDVFNKSRNIMDFENELYALKKVQNISSNEDNDMIINHLRNVKNDYQEKGSDELRKHLFPETENYYEETYNVKDLSFESEVSPPKENENNTRKLAPNRNRSKSGKNFLAANKMKLAEIEENRKEKEKKALEEQTKKRAQAEALKRKLKDKEEDRRLKSAEKKRTTDKNKLNINHKKKNAEPVTLQVEKQPETTMLKSNKFSIRSAESEIKLYVEDDKSEISKVEMISNFGNEEKYQEFTIQEGENEDYSSKNVHSEQNQQKENDEELRTVRRGEERDVELQDENADKFQEEEHNEEEGGGEVEKEKEDVRISDNFIHVSYEDTVHESEKKLLRHDINEYQSEIRAYIDSGEQYNISQQFVHNSEISKYLQKITLVANKEAKGLNCHTNICSKAEEHRLVLILVATDKQNGSEVGVSVFHKQDDGDYLCDYVMVHNMKNFFSFIVNVCKYIFNADLANERIQFFFDLQKLENNLSWVHFLEFEEKCKRMGEIHIQKDDEHTKKYILRRNLFQPIVKNSEEGKPINFSSSLRVHKDYFKEKGVGFENTIKGEFVSSTVLLSSYLKKNKQMFEVFKKSCEEELKHRELLLTTMMFQKKEVEIKNCTTYEYPIEERIDLSNRLSFAFNIDDPTHSTEELRFKVENSLNNKTKRVTLQLEQEKIKYLILNGDQNVTKIQSSNSSLSGVFLDLLPKYKVLVIEAGEFLEMCKINPEMNAFFYVKHYIKNVSNVKKEEHEKIFIPEIYENNQIFLPDLSEKTKSSIFVNETISLGWGNEAKSSIVYTPSHKDLVIAKPFIISVLSGVIEKVIEGTPLFATVIL